MDIFDKLPLELQLIVEKEYLDLFLSEHKVKFKATLLYIRWSPLQKLFQRNYTNQLKYCCRIFLTRSEN
jgi:hypothetical protein